MIDIDETTDALVTCIHEAGHVLACHDGGSFEVAYVSIDPAFIINHPPEGAPKEWGFGSTGVSMALSAHLVNPVLRRGYFADECERELIRNYCVQCLAGPAAESLYCCEPDAQACWDNDMHQVCMVISRLWQGNFNRKKHFNQFRKEAEAFARANKDTLLNLATAIYNRKTIAGADIASVIANARRVDKVAA